MSSQLRIAGFMRHSLEAIEVERSKVYHERTARRGDVWKCLVWVNTPFHPEAAGGAVCARHVASGPHKFWDILIFNLLREFIAELH